MILQGTAQDGSIIPVQVDSQGRLVAEGLQGPAGPAGPPGPEGPAGGSGAIRLVGVREGSEWKIGPLPDGLSRLEVYGLGATESSGSTPEVSLWLQSGKLNITATGLRTYLSTTTAQTASITSEPLKTGVGMSTDSRLSFRLTRVVDGKWFYESVAAGASRMTHYVLSFDATTFDHVTVSNYSTGAPVFVGLAWE